MNWYVYSSGLDPENPEKLNAEQIIALIHQNTIGKNAQVMKEGDRSKKWVNITKTEFATVFDEVKAKKAAAKAAKKTKAKVAKQVRQPQVQPQVQNHTINISSKQGEYLYDGLALMILVFAVLSLLGGGYVGHLLSNGNMDVTIAASLGSSFFWFSMSAIVQHLNIIANGYLKKPRGYSGTVVIVTLLIVLIPVLLGIFLLASKTRHLIPNQQVL